MSNKKMKGLLKGLRYISQVFDAEEKEPEIRIGYPTDVKHVSHIGWDGPSVNAPSWMNEFKSVPGTASGPQNFNGDINNKEPDNQVKQVSYTKDKSDKPRPPRKSSKHSLSKDSSDGSRSMSNDPDPAHDVPVPDIPKRCRSKKSSSSGGGSGGSSKARSRAPTMDPNSNQGSPPRTGSKSKNKQRSSKKDAQRETGSDVISSEIELL